VRVNRATGSICHTQQPSRETRGRRALRPGNCISAVRSRYAGGHPAGHQGPGGTAAGRESDGGLGWPSCLL